MQNFLLILPIESGIIKVVQNDAPVCRNGRRGGLKIPCANNTCGFDPHHRHQASSPDFFQVPGCFIFVANHTFVFSGKVLAQKVGADAPAHRVDIDIIEIIRAVILAADLPVQRLLFLHLFEHLLTGRDQRKGAAAGFCLGSSAQKYAV